MDDLRGGSGLGVVVMMASRRTGSGDWMKRPVQESLFWYLCPSLGLTLKGNSYSQRLFIQLVILWSCRGADHETSGAKG